MATETAARHSLEESHERLRLVPESPSSGSIPQREFVRAVALRADRARHVLNNLDYDHARRLWEGLLSGRWTLLDWFDSEGRRFIIAKRSDERPHPARGLTPRERQVALYAALGQSSKAIAYELGISPSRVSALLKASMAKLGVRSKAQLVVMVRALQAQHSPSSVSAAVGELNG